MKKLLVALLFTAPLFGMQEESSFCDWSDVQTLFPSSDLPNEMNMDFAFAPTSPEVVEPQNFVPLLAPTENLSVPIAK